MDNTYRNEDLKNCEILDAAVSELCPTANIRNIGTGLMVIHANGSISSVFTVANNICDFSAKTCANDDIERAGLDFNTTLRLVKAIDMLPTPTVEQSTSIDAAPVQAATPSTGSSDVQSWWATGQHFPRGHVSSSLNLSEAAALAEKLLAMRPENDADEVCEDDETGFYTAMKELAEESGKASDIMRNKSLVNLMGLGVETSPEDDEVTLDEFLAGMTPTPAHLEGKRMHGGKPVSLTEGRDISRPYQNTLGGKVLVDLGFPHGVQLIDCQDMPRQKYLSNSDAGVVMVEGFENVDFRRRKWRGWK